MSGPRDVAYPARVFGGGIFIENAVSDPAYFVTVVFTVIFSITLHELAHGVVATRLGDPTPEQSGRMTLNPVVHMGPYSLIVLALLGIAWGQMPVDPTRLRGKYAEAKVALAGPLTNLALALLALTALGLWMRFLPAGVSPDEGAAAIGWPFLFTFGLVNVALFVFNLLPVPPLDGSHILANFSRGYANFIRNPANGGVTLVLFIGVFLLAGRIFTVTTPAVAGYLTLVRGY